MDPPGVNMANHCAHVIDETLIRNLAEGLLPDDRPEGRIIIGLAGIPGSGKSTLGQRLVETLHRRAPGVAVLVPMDGFHLPNARLADLDLRSRKGAPETFDAAAYLELLHGVRSGVGPIFFPIYDRKRHEPVMDHTPEHTIAPHVRVVVTEGNYLLLDMEPWNRLEMILDACWFLDTPVDIARQWTIQRHIHGGRNPKDAAVQYEHNDAVNTKLVLARRRRADLILRWAED